MRRVDALLDAAILRAAGALGNRWSAVALFLMPWVSFPAALVSGDPVVIVLWMSSTFLQLFFLPVLLIAGNAQAAATERVIRETHDAALAEMADLRAIAQALHVHLTGAEHPGAEEKP